MPRQGHAKKRVGETKSGIWANPQESRVNPGTAIVLLLTGHMMPTMAKEQRPSGGTATASCQLSQAAWEPRSRLSQYKRLAVGCTSRGCSCARDLLIQADRSSPSRSPSLVGGKFHDVDSLRETDLPCSTTRRGRDAGGEDYQKADRQLPAGLENWGRTRTSAGVIPAPRVAALSHPIRNQSQAYAIL
jgi:hypothetical protein